MTDIGVTDHAVLRWIERVAGIDVDAIRERMIEEIAGAARAAANAGLPERYSVRTSDAVYVLDSGTVVTVLSPEQHTLTLMRSRRRR